VSEIQLKEPKPEKPKEAALIFDDEESKLLKIIKKIMYSEGDTLDLKHECALYLHD